MFERFTVPAREVVEAARTHSRRLGHVWIGTEHLLAALVEIPSPAADHLIAGGLTVESVERSIGELLDDEHASDRDALAHLGIDLDRVREAIEADVGPEAWEADEDRPARWWQRARNSSRPSGYITFTRRAKKCLELALREAILLKHTSIGPEHILLGILREGNGMATAVIARAGISPDTLRSSLEESLRASA